MKKQNNKQFKYRQPTFKLSSSCNLFYQVNSLKVWLMLPFPNRKQNCPLSTATTQAQVHSDTPHLQSHDHPQPDVSRAARWAAQLLSVTSAPPLNSVTHLSSPLAALPSRRSQSFSAGGETFSEIHPFLTSPLWDPPPIRQPSLPKFADSPQDCYDL